MPEPALRSAGNVTGLALVPRPPRAMLFWLQSALLVGLFARVSAQNASDSLAFSVLSGGNSNYFRRDNTTAAQLVLSGNASAVQRLVVALPAGNSGALAYFLANGSDTLNVDLVESSLSTTRQAFGMVGIRGTLAFSSNATLGVTILGATRAVRDYVEGGGTMHEVSVVPCLRSSLIGAASTTPSPTTRARGSYCIGRFSDRPTRWISRSTLPLA